MTGTVGEVVQGVETGELISRLLVGSVCGARATERGRRTYMTFLVVVIICHRPRVYRGSYIHARGHGSHVV